MEIKSSDAEINKGQMTYEEADRIRQQMHMDARRELGIADYRGYKSGILFDKDHEY